MVEARKATVGQVHPAGVGRRLAALLYDWMLLIGVYFPVTGLLLLFRGGRVFERHDPAYLSILVITGFLFFSWFWTHGGQTLGMRAWRLQLISTDDRPPTWQQAIVRCIAAIAGGGMAGLGYLMMLFDPESRCLHDIVSRTRVMRRRDIE